MAESGPSQGLGGGGAPLPLRVELRPLRATILVVLEGELDMAGAALLGPELEHLIGAGFSRVIVDLRDVTFLDSTGLRTLLNADAATRGTEAEFALIAGPAPVQRVFALTKTDDALRFIEPSDVDARAR
jgi:anti-anti-sigma factor